MDPIHINAARSWANGLGLTREEVQKQLQNPIQGFGLSPNQAAEVTTTVFATLEAEQAAEAERAAACAAGLNAARVQWHAIRDQHIREVTVYDEDGVGSKALRLSPEGLEALESAGFHDFEPFERDGKIVK